jgi:thermostable 8-oxoguanine DNA glycosylase
MSIETDELEIARKCRSVAEKMGERYIEEHIDQRWNPDALTENWFKALEFWFSKSFFRGRRDSISIMFLNRALGVVQSFGKDKILATPEDVIEGALMGAGVNNHIDRKMVIESIKFLRSIKDNNIVKYCLLAIKDRKTVEVYNELINIHGIGPKLASFFLRDLCFLYRIEPATKEELICVQPVDTWVRKVAVRLGIPGCTPDKHEAQTVEPIVSFCTKHKISPLKFNCGAWYAGALSFDILIDSL